MVYVPLCLSVCNQFGKNAVFIKLLFVQMFVCWCHYYCYKFFVWFFFSLSRFKFVEIVVWSFHSLCLHFPFIVSFCVNLWIAFLHFSFVYLTKYLRTNRHIFKNTLGRVHEPFFQSSSTIGQISVFGCCCCCCFIKNAPLNILTIITHRQTRTQNVAYHGMKNKTISFKIKNRNLFQNS